MQRLPDAAAPIEAATAKLSAGPAGGLRPCNLQLTMPCRLGLLNSYSTWRASAHAQNTENGTTAQVLLFLCQCDKVPSIEHRH